ncbi:class III lanthipeptide [Deinococcus gobiensis]|jgi:hypothetical protein|nr:class III lanthipeptide [Deinococcus gobiensis]
MKRVLQLQTLQASNPAPAEWSTVSNHCGSHQLA